MMVRALDSENDWTFGQGLNDYKSANVAVVQNIKTRLNSFLGDCFFDQAAGINWFTLLGGKDELSLNLAITGVILNTANVLSIVQLFSNLDNQRRFSVSYTVTTTYSASASSGVVQISI